MKKYLNNKIGGMKMKKSILLMGLLFSMIVMAVGVNASDSETEWVSPANNSVQTGGLVNITATSTYCCFNATLATPGINYSVFYFRNSNPQGSWTEIENTSIVSGGGCNLVNLSNNTYCTVGFAPRGNVTHDRYIEINASFYAGNGTYINSSTRAMLIDVYALNYTWLNPATNSKLTNGSNYNHSFVVKTSEEVEALNMKFNGVNLSATPNNSRLEWRADFKIPAGVWTAVAESAELGSSKSSTTSSNSFVVSATGSNIATKLLLAQGAQEASQAGTGGLQSLLSGPDIDLGIIKLPRALIILVLVGLLIYAVAGGRRK